MCMLIAAHVKLNNNKNVKDVRKCTYVKDVCKNLQIEQFALKIY